MNIWDTIVLNVLAPAITGLVAWFTMRRKNNAEANNLEITAYTSLIEPLKSTIQCLEDRVQKLECENKRIMDQNIELLTQIHQLRVENLELKQLVESFKRGRKVEKPQE